MSGISIRPSFDKYLKSGELNAQSKRRPDFRSSAHKRLMPQLALKVPIFRRWGKRFFVAVDSTFFAQLPKMPEQSESNGEVSWLNYDFKRHANGGYTMQPPTVIHTLWDDVEYALQEGTAPEKSEILAQLTASAKRLSTFVT